MEVTTGVLPTACSGWGLRCGGKKACRAKNHWREAASRLCDRTGHCHVMEDNGSGHFLSKAFGECTDLIMDVSEPCVTSPPA